MTDQTPTQPSNRCARMLLPILLAAALAIRLGWGLSRPSDDASLKSLPDQIEYLQIARNLLDGRGVMFFDPDFNDTVYAYRMPGYPAFIALCGAKTPIVRIAQALIDTSTVLAIYLLAMYSFPLPRIRGGGLGWGSSVGDLAQTLTPTLSHAYMGERVALFAGALVALNPYLIYFSATLLSETLFTALMAWGMVLMIRPNRIAFVSGILLLIASVYVRPGAIGLPVLLAIVAQLVRVVPSGRSFWRMPAGTLAIVLLLVCLLPWAYRNHLRVKAWIFTTTNSGVTAYDGFNPLADGSSNQASFRRWPELKTMGEVERSEYLGAQAKQHVMENPSRALWLAMKKLQRMWSPMPLSAEFGSNVPYVAAGLIFAVPLFAMVLLGMWYGRISRSLKLYLLIPALYFTMVHALSVGSLRYRVPSDAPMAVLAAAGAAGFISRPRRASTDAVE